jgi:DNA-binding transcriptional ArsR family regulator
MQAAWRQSGAREKRVFAARPATGNGIGSLAGPALLREAGLVNADRRGTWAYYRARPGIMRQLAALFTVFAAVLAG